MLFHINYMLELLYFECCWAELNLLNQEIPLLKRIFLVDIVCTELAPLLGNQSQRDSVTNVLDKTARQGYLKWSCYAPGYEPGLM